MRVFVIFGDIEFIDGDAYIRTTDYSGMYWEDEVEETSRSFDMDYITPHYFNGRITFMQYHKEHAE